MLLPDEAAGRFGHLNCGDGPRADRRIITALFSLSRKLTSLFFTSCKDD